MQQEQLVPICAVSGMGGIGKTELAVQYVRHHLQQQTYPGGVCWLNAQEEVGTQIITFVRSQFEQEPPDNLELEDRVGWCWKQFQDLDSLIVFDDVQDYQAIKPFLPPIDLPFKIVLTTRLQLQEDHVHLFTIDKLQPLAAFQLLYQTLRDESRIAKEQTLAEQLCEWLGYLPLGIKLVAKFLKVEPDLSLQAMLVQLETEKLKHDGLTPIEAVFELSWKKLSTAERQLAVLLGLFAVAPIEWRWVDELVQACRVKPRQSEPQQWYELLEPKALERGRRRLVELSLLQYVDTETYQLHPLLREFFAAKLSDTERKPLKRAFATTMIGVAKQIPYKPTLELIQSVTIGIPHLKEAATDLRTLERTDELYLQNGDDLIWAFIGIGRFYEGQGLYVEAETWYRQCVTVVRSLLGERHPVVAAGLNNLAELYRAQGRYKEAEPLYQQALELSRSLLGERHPVVAAGLNNLAELYRAQGRYEEAEPLYQQALELRRSLLGERHPDVAASLNNLAELYCAQGRYEEAEPLYQQALELRRSLLGEHHPDVAASLNNLAKLYCAQGRYEGAEPLYQQALELNRLLLGERHPDVAASLNNLAKLYCAQGRYEGAEPLYQQALKLSRSLLGECHPNVAAGLNNLAELYRAQGRYEEAEPLYQQALKLSRSLLGEGHPDVAMNLNNLAELYRAQGRYEEAEPLYQQALELRRSLLGERHPDRAASLNSLAELYRAQGRYEEAEPLYQQALELQRLLLGERHPDRAASLNNLAALYGAQGRYEEAEPLYQQALELNRSLLGERHPRVAMNLNNLAALYRAQGRYEDAEPLYQQAMQIGIQTLGRDHPDVAVWSHNLAELYVTLRCYAEAEPLYLQAISVFYQRLGETHPNTQTALKSFLSLVQQVVQDNRTDELSDHPMTRSLLQQMQNQES